MLRAHKVFFALVYGSLELVATMKNLLAFFLLAPLALLAQENPSYDPDYNGDDCYTVTDVLSLLPLFGSCIQADTTWACGDSTLYDDYWYATTLIGEQCWFAENLRTSQYSDGTQIVSNLTNSEWSSVIEGATTFFGANSGDGGCFYVNTDLVDWPCGLTSLNIYGRLYNWYAVNDTRGLCPSGWHVPTDGEWNDLESFIQSQGYSGVEGLALKSTSGWLTSFGQVNGPDAFGFVALPGGERYPSGVYNSSGLNGKWWSSSLNGAEAWTRSLIGLDMNLFKISKHLGSGLSIRCLKDSD